MQLAASFRCRSGRLLATGLPPEPDTGRNALYLGDEWIDPGDRESIAVENPDTCEGIATRASTHESLDAPPVADCYQEPTGTLSVSIAITRT
jgi:hypothetical protein